MPESAADFTFFGTAEDFLDLIISNLNRVYGAGTWSKGTCKSTNAKQLFSSGENCLTLIGRMAQEFEGEFYVSGSADRTINFVDYQGGDTGITLQYKSGIFNIERRTVDPENLITRLYAYGGERNIPSDYRSRAGRLMFESGGKNYVEGNTNLYEIIEATKLFDDIYPHRDGEITSVDGTNAKIFYDTGIDFNINDYLLPGITAKVHFQSGNLAGYEFEISAFDNATKKITIVEFTDGDGITLPDASLKPASGDKYVILDVEMPASYVAAAEAELLSTAQEYLNNNNVPKVEYVIDVDDHYLKTNNLSFDIGDLFTIIDTDLGINGKYRIVELEQSVCYSYMYKFKLAKTIRAPQLIERIYQATTLTEREIALRKKDYITTFQLMNKIFIAEDEIALRVTTEDFESEVSVLNNAINLKVGTDTFNSAISVLSGQIALRVQKNDVINQINISTEGIKIDGDNIAINGSTSFSSGYDPTTKTAKVGGTYDSAESGARVRIFPDANTGIQVIDDSGNDVFVALVGGTNVGDIVFGDVSAGKYIQYDKSAEEFLMYIDDLQIGSPGTSMYWRLWNWSGILGGQTLYEPDGNELIELGGAGISSYRSFLRLREYNDPDSTSYNDYLEIGGISFTPTGDAGHHIGFYDESADKSSNIRFLSNGNMDLKADGYFDINPTGDLKINNTAGLTQVINLASVTSITVTKGIITAAA